MLKAKWKIPLLIAMCIVLTVGLFALYAFVSVQRIIVEFQNAVESREFDVLTGRLSSEVSIVEDDGHFGFIPENPEIWPSALGTREQNISRPEHVGTEVLSPFHVLIAFHSELLDVTDRGNRITYYVEVRLIGLFFRIVNIESF